MKYVEHNCPRCGRQMFEHPVKLVWRCGNVCCPLFEVPQTPLDKPKKGAVE